MDLRDLKVAYLTSPHFRDIYLYLLQNRMPLGKGVAQQLDQNARNYLILDGLLFKILDDGEGNLDRVLCIPTSKVHILFNAYHPSILGGHTGITKYYHTISQRFYCPNLAENLRAYITGCHVCQMFRKGKDFERPYQKRINLNVPAMTKISMDIKQMPVNKGYSHILVLQCEVTNYMVALLLMSTRTPHILDAFQRGYLAYFGPPTHVVCDQDPAFTSSLMEAFVTQVNIKVILVSPTNHQSLQAEHGIKSLSGLLVKHLSTVWSWHSVLPYSMLCYNGYLNPNLNGYSPYELVFGHNMTLYHELEIKVDTVVSGTFKDYYENLKKNLQYMGEILQRFRSQRLDLLNKDREYQAFEVGQIVYICGIARNTRHSECAIATVLLSIYGCLRQFLGGRVLDAVHLKHVILFADVMLLNGTVMSYVISQHCMCIGHMSFYYKRATDTSMGGSCLLFICSSGSTLSPETCMWLVPNACRLQHV